MIEDSKMDIKNYLYSISKKDSNILDMLENYIVNQYRGRSYHNLSHINSCLKEFNEYIDYAENNGLEPLHSKSIVFAILYHDIIMCTEQNEHLSAERAYLDGMLLGLPEDLLNIAYKCIIATKHDSIPVNSFEKIMIDVDLSILGQSESIYKDYTLNIRLEYSHIPASIFYPKRKEILSNFLNRSSIFTLDYFKDKYEKAARYNIASEINGY